MTKLLPVGVERVFPLVLFLLFPVQAFSLPASSCPKILMFDGFDIQTQLDEAHAHYWGEEIGVNGFFLNNVLASWENSVGEDDKSPFYQKVKQFQDLYSKHGVTDNFIKVALYKPHDWTDPAAQSRIVSNFRQAAHLAKYASLTGIALDLEPQAKGFWEEDPSVPDKDRRVFLLGKRIGGAILSEFPEATAIVLPEILVYTCPPYDQAICRAYKFSPKFLDGLVQSHFERLILATENSYNSAFSALIAKGVREKYRAALQDDGLAPDSVPVALGLWPLGKTYTDKTARTSPGEFEKRLREAFQQPSPYLWIYGHGSAWQKDGPYGKGDVDPHFQEYVQVIHRIKQACSGSP